MSLANMMAVSAKWSLATLILLVLVQSNASKNCGKELPPLYFETK